MAEDRRADWFAAKGTRPGGEIHGSERISEESGGRGRGAPKGGQQKREGEEGRLVVWRQKKAMPVQVRDGYSPGER